MTKHSSTTDNAELLEAAVEEYRLSLNGVEFWTPYWREELLSIENPNPMPGPFKGKGTPGELLEFLEENLAIDMPVATSNDMRWQMRALRLGIDCSGFAYHVLEFWLRQALDVDLADHVFKPRTALLEDFHNPLLRHPTHITQELLERQPELVSLATIHQFWGNQPRRLANVKVLTGPATTVSVESAAEVRPGDIVQMMGADGIAHCVVITSTQPELIRFAHAARSTPEELGGVEFGHITITDSSKSLILQDWEGINVRAKTLHVEPVRRLKVMTDAAD